MLKEKLKTHRSLYLFSLYFYSLFKRTKDLFMESKRRKEYYKQVEKIKRDKKIIANLAFGGIGDCLAFSTLPRLLKEKYDVDFYLSSRSLDVIRQKDTYKLCFEMNPYFKGVSDEDEVFTVKSFVSEISLKSFFTDREGENIIEKLERQFKVKGKGIPELYYKPKLLEEYQHIVLVDENTISGKKFGWKFKDDAFYKEALRYRGVNDAIEYADPHKQDLFTYVDMIYSCKRFVATFSGGASIAACFNKPFSVIWPYNAINGSNYPFRFKNSAGNYVK